MRGDLVEIHLISFAGVGSGQLNAVLVGTLTASTLKYGILQGVL